MDAETIIKSLRLCASEESRCIVCQYRSNKSGNCIAKLQRDAADALERLEDESKTLMRLMRQQAAEMERRDRLLKEQEAAIQTALDVAEERRQEAACASEFQCALSPHPDGDPHILACVRCGSGEYLVNWDGNRNTYCGQCGQKIDWSGEKDG